MSSARRKKKTSAFEMRQAENPSSSPAANPECGSASQNAMVLVDIKDLAGGMRAGVSGALLQTLAETSTSQGANRSR